MSGYAKIPVEKFEYTATYTAAEIASAQNIPNARGRFTITISDGTDVSFDVRGGDEYTTTYHVVPNTVSGCTVVSNQTGPNEIDIEHTANGSQFEFLFNPARGYQPTCRLFGGALAGAAVSFTVTYWA